MALHTQASLDATKELSEDGKVARGAKQLAIAAQATAMNLLKRGYKISEKLTEEELQQLPTKERLRALKTIADFAVAATTSAEAAIKLERAILGEPAEIHEHRHVHVQVEPAQMAETIERAQRALARARDAGIIDVAATEPEQRATG